MESVGAYEAKTNLSKLLDRVAEGERIVITRHGAPLAILQPFYPEKSGNVNLTIMEIRKFRETKNLSGLSVREMIEEGRR